MFNIFSFFKKSSKVKEPKYSVHETVESNLRKDEDKEAKVDDSTSISRTLDESHDKKLDEHSVLERVLEERRKTGDDIIVESKMNKDIKRVADEKIDTPLINVLGMKNDKKNNDLFAEAMGKMDSKESIFKKYVNSQLNREPKMVQDNIEHDRSELANRYDRLKDEGYIPDHENDFQSINNSIEDRKPVKLEKIASILDQVSKLDEIMLLEYVNSSQRNIEVDSRIIKDVEDKKRELLQQVMGI